MTFFLHASVDWNGMRCGGGGGGKTTPRAFVIISARRRAMTRDAGPLPGRISAFTTGLQSCRYTGQPGRLERSIPYFTRPHPVIRTSCGGAVSICVT